MSKLKISDEFCYDSNKKSSICILNKALKNYSDKLEIALNLKGEIPIIPDTNVLLTYYGMSQKDKTNLLHFFEENKNRIFLTKQVEAEFLRNRISTIQSNFFMPLNNVYSEYNTVCDQVKDKLTDFLNKKKKLLSKDYPNIWSALKAKQNKLNQILGEEDNLGEQIKQAIEETTTDNKNINVNDKLIEVCSHFSVLPQLDEDEIKFIKQQYDSLWEKHESKSQEKKKEFVFPGCGDKNKKSDPYGDFIIFHEILKFMKCQGKDINEGEGTDVIFLTYEKNKYDWINNDMSPIVHYIERAYLNTEQSLFIIHAERPLETISFENIHQDELDQNIVRESTIKTLNKEGGWGFIATKNNNLYFNRSLMKNNEQFDVLEEQDVVRYQIGKNEHGDDIATKVEKIIYSFDNNFFSIIEGSIVSIKKSDGFGFIYASPENLYFHRSYVLGETNFDGLNKLDKVQYIEGKNEYGNSIARLVRKIES